MCLFLSTTHHNTPSAAHLLTGLGASDDDHSEVGHIDSVTIEPLEHGSHSFIDSTQHIAPVAVEELDVSYALDDVCVVIEGEDGAGIVSILHDSNADGGPKARHLVPQVGCQEAPVVHVLWAVLKASTVHDKHDVT